MSGPTRKDKRVNALVQVTQDAYSFERYGRAQWFQVISWLRRRRYTDEQILAIMNSRAMRHAADAKGQATAAAFGEWWEDLGNFGGTKQGRQEYVDQQVAAQTPEVEEDPAELVAEAAAVLEEALHTIKGTFGAFAREETLVNAIKSALEKIEGAQAAGCR